MSVRYTAKDLGEVADVFETYASDARAINGRRYGTKRDQRDREISAQTWVEGANMLRNVDIVSEPDHMKAALALWRHRHPTNPDPFNNTPAVCDRYLSDVAVVLEAVK